LEGESSVPGRLAAASKTNMETTPMTKILPINKILISAAVAGLMLSTGAVFAEDAVATPEYAAVDANADASVSFEELSAAWPGVTEDQFKTADADASGGLSAEEYATLAVTPAP
jgi:hypothetical protein